MSFWDIPLQNPYRFYYHEPRSLADVVGDMFDLTFPPVRYENRRQRPAALDQSSQQQQQQQLQQSRSDDNKLQIAQLDVSHYRPEEVSCKVEDGKVLVSGKHHSENEYGYEATEFHRSYSLPKGVDPSSIRSRISQDGVLQIEAMKEQPKAIPLTEAEAVDETDDKKMSFKIDLGGFKPEEVNVRMKGKELMVSAEHKSETDGHFTFRQFKRSFTVPENVDATTLVSKFNKDGILSIQASKCDVPAIEEKKIDVEETEEMAE